MMVLLLRLLQERCGAFAHSQTLDLLAAALQDSALLQLLLLLGHLKKQSHCMGWLCSFQPLAPVQLLLLTLYKKKQNAVQ
jgi:hypothetical protein